VRRGGLEKHRLIAFATPAFAAGELTGSAEPALVLSPPEQASADDDGLLTASEIATLKLGADWVVLSGTTSAADAVPDARGLAMLVKAFGHAGARSVLVAHWGVSADASGRLIGAMVDATKQERTIGRAEALRRAELALLHPSSPPEFAHPMAWAAFTLDGDGGQGR
jgi:CHAT domain-containing protein